VFYWIRDTRKYRRCSSVSEAQYSMISLKTFHSGTPQELFTRKTAYPKEREKGIEKLVKNVIETKAKNVSVLFCLKNRTMKEAGGLKQV